MLSILMEANRKLYSKELMSLNLYLNNVSEHLDFYSKNNEKIFDTSNKTFSILKGYLMIHDYFLEQFENMILKYCRYVTYDEVFVYCPDYNKSGEYTIENFRYVANRLKNRLLQRDIQQNDIDDNIKNLEHSEIYFVFNKAVKRSEYWGFLPKNVLLYDFMMNDCKIPEKDLMISSQNEQYPLLINRQNESVLDMIRFAPLTYKCPDKRHITIFDIFRYIKYTLYRKEVQVFHTLILTATFRPIILLVRLFIRTIKELIYVYIQKNEQEVPLKYYENIISVGKRILECFQNFVDLNLFGNDSKIFFSSFLYKTSDCLKHFIYKRTRDTMISCSKWEQLSKSFLFNNKLVIKNPTEIFTENSIDELFEKLAVNLKQSEEFVKELKEHDKVFKFTKKTFYVNHILNFQYTYIFHRNIIDNLCRTKDSYTSLFGDAATQIVRVKEKSNANDNKNRKKQIVVYQNHSEKIIVNSYDECDINYCYNPNPKYLINYILFT
ncbi:uncharacterized protein LOC126907792 [Daktulosphaira vitifoliae]|uniref:uncharacterized protein LOC126907792 n=1 Tax=Daktulosphaira vitifoliae TaxID=58002 RepID=UPI0021A9DA92|nr:uncharacterized protein LOC126907792 [Daktulosphaira vitifoliae]